MNENFSLTIIIGGEKPYDFELKGLDEGIITFGRNEGNNLVLDSEIVSNFHGFFSKDNNDVYINDRNSTNGIFINNAKIHEKTALKYGDTITFESEYAKKTQTLGSGVSMIFNSELSSGLWSIFKLRNNAVVIGRDPKADLVLNVGGISLFHGKIIYENEKYYILENSGTKGIYVNGERIIGKRKLENRDIIFIGNAKLIYDDNLLYYSKSQKSVPIDVINIGKDVVHKKSLRKILRDINFSIKPNEFVAIIGGSGTGKSTLMNGICGMSRPSEGNVLYDNEELYENYDALKSLIGYVPQEDIVHKDLTLYKMLMYTAEIRMPNDSTKEERIKRVNEVIDMVELKGREDTLIKKLSGGQQKRASIAVELISDPSVFFLDEPTSGLDPGTERNLMNTLKKLTYRNKTVIMITHMTMNINLCDKLIILGEGGRLCFFGDPKGALDFFGVSDFVDIYDKLMDNANQWQLKFENSNYYEKKQFINSKKNTKDDKKRNKNKTSSFKQLIVLSKRYLEILFSDKRRLGILLIQAPLLAILLSFVSYNTNYQGEVTVFKYAGEAKSFLFALSCAAFWIGILNSIQEICKERDILKRELMANLKILPYVFSKLLVLGTLCIFQSVFLIFISLIILRGLPPGNLGINSYFGMYLNTFLTAFSAACLGLLVSGVSKNSDRAMTMAPIILMPQILFSGIAFNLKGYADYFSNIINCKWSVKGFCIIANINKLPLNKDSTGVTFQSVEYDSNILNLLNSFGALILISFICILLTITFLHLELKE